MKTETYLFPQLLNKIVILIALLFLYTLPIVMYSQDTTPASGGNASGTGGSVSYTTGQIVYTTNTGTNGSLSQGVQQPYEISVVTGIEESSDISLAIVVYPNPAKDFIRLKIVTPDVENISYQFYDINGSLIIGNKVVGPETDISIQNISPSTYFLKVNDKNKVLKTFKIIKN
jgi:hypothetical protein